MEKVLPTATVEDRESYYKNLEKENLTLSKQNSLLNSKNKELSVYKDLFKLSDLLIQNISNLISYYNENINVIATQAKKGE